MRENGSQGEEGGVPPYPPVGLSSQCSRSTRHNAIYFCFYGLGTLDALRDLGILSHSDAPQVKQQNLHALPSSKVNLT